MNSVGQPHSQFNMFERANDIKSNLILSLFSWIQVDERRMAGGIIMGGLIFFVHAMPAMKYVVVPLW